MLAFPKPTRLNRRADPVRIYSDGRELCRRTTVGGETEYQKRKWLMYARQKGICCLFGHIEGCIGVMQYAADVTFEHEDGRGMGGAKRDDRIEKDGRPYNGAAHQQCNHAKGSRFIDYNERVK